ncbi:hypothetical protein QTP70_007922 [Hemibagrus guttatus]|uniref:Uncharacterized protein n=1 Tax=Hemibagrus guttatus TaxID=175788 RepID=A0AAE0V793_9TELE|nr:hypothetical protein QTP70_007922 [Hemibagrus guttatus]
MDIYSTRCIRKANSIVDDPTNPSHTLFTLLPSGKMYRSIRAHRSRLLNSFFPQAIRGCLCRGALIYNLSENLINDITIVIHLLKVQTRDQGDQ